MNEIEMVISIVLMTILVIIAALIIMNISNTTRNTSEVIDPNSAASVFDDFYIPRFRIGQIDTCQAAAGSVTTVLATCDSRPYGADCICYYNDDCASGYCEGTTGLDPGICTAPSVSSSGSGLKVNVEVISEEGITLEGIVTLKSVPKDRLIEYSEKESIESGENEFMYTLAEAGGKPYYLSVEVRNKAGKLVIFKLEYIEDGLESC